jgi:hypothetical protein
LDTRKLTLATGREQGNRAATLRLQKLKVVPQCSSEAQVLFVTASGRTD